MLSPGRGQRGDDGAVPGRGLQRRLWQRGGGGAPRPPVISIHSDMSHVFCICKTIKIHNTTPFTTSCKNIHATCDKYVLGLYWVSDPKSKTSMTNVKGNFFRRS